MIPITSLGTWKQGGAVLEIVIKDLSGPSSLFFTYPFLSSLSLPDPCMRKTRSALVSENYTGASDVRVHSMNGREIFGFLQGSAREALMRTAHGFDLNFPPPDQITGQVDNFPSPNAPDQMQGAEHGQLQPQSMHNAHNIDDEISILTPNAFSEARKNHLRYVETFMTNNNLGLYRGYDHINEFMEAYSTHGHMNLSRDVQLYCYLENSGGIPFSPPFPKRRRTGPHTSNICTNLQVNRTIKARDVSTTPEEPQREASPTEATLNCPICLCGLREETSTKCGHIFCKQCIEQAIVAQHKCPTCRRKLRKNDIIRIYLPRSTT